MKWTHICLAIIGLLFAGCEAENPQKEPSELVKNLNLLYDPNFYQIDRAVWLSIVVSDVNVDTIEEAACLLREIYPTTNAKEVIDIEVTIGDETHTTSFEDLFEWMGFKREEVDYATAKNNGCR